MWQELIDQILGQLETERRIAQRHFDTTGEPAKNGQEQGLSKAISIIKESVEEWQEVVLQGINGEDDYE